MKRHLFLFLLSLATVAAARADVLLVEDFDYPNGDLLTDHGWFTEWNAPDNLTTTSGLNFEGYAGCGVGNAASFDTDTDQPIHLNLSEEITTGDVYVAFMIQPFWVSKNSYFLALRNKDMKTYTMNGRVYIDEDNMLGLSFGKDKTTCVTYEKSLQQGKVYLVVMKYHIVDGSNNDEVSLYILNEMLDEEPAEPQIGPLTDASKADINPALLQLHCDHGDGAEFVVDGIRVATTWAEAVLAGECPEDAVIDKDEDWNKADDSGNSDGADDSSDLQPIKAEKNMRIYNALGTFLGEYDLLPELPRGLYFIKKDNHTIKIIL